MATIRVLLVDDHRLMLEGIRSLLAGEDDIEVVGTAGTVESAVAAATTLAPDVVLMDFRLPDGDGAAAAERIRRDSPDTAILFLSADASDSAVLRAVEAGACGYVAKDSGLETLLDAVHRAADGEFLLPAATMARLLQKQRRDRAESDARRGLIEEVSPREMEVLRLMAAGRDNQAIAGELGIGYGTVRSHVRHVLEKLYAHSRLEAVANARNAGLIEA